MRARYRKLSDGEWSTPMSRGFSKIACCDCGLVHMFQIRRLRSGQFVYRAWRDNRATVAKRRTR
jgi:transcription elongation factor Elf1